MSFEDSSTRSPRHTDHGTQWLLHLTLYRHLTLPTPHLPLTYRLPRRLELHVNQ